MCLYSDWPTYKIAERDIVCFKILFEDFKAPVFNNYCYKKGQLNVLEENIKYATEAFRWNSSGVMVRAVTTGFHSCISRRAAWKTKKDYISRFQKHIICKCIIPKGAQYIKGEFGQIVSNKLIVKRKLLFNLL